MTFKREWRHGIFLLPHEGIVILEDAEFWKKPPQQRIRIMRTARHMMKYCNDLKKLAFSESREGGIYHVINNMQEIENAYSRVSKNIFLTKEERSKYKRIYELYLDWKAEEFGPIQKKTKEWESIFAPGKYKEFKCKSEWEKLSEQDLLDMLQYLSDGASDSKVPRGCG